MGRRKDPGDTPQAEQPPGAAPAAGLSRRERQIMSALYRMGEGTVRDVVDTIPEAPSYNSVRVTLGILERKGHVRHREDGRRYVYAPVIAREKASARAVRDTFRTFFQDRPSQAVLAMLDAASTRLTDEELEEIEARICSARGEEGG